MLIDDDRVLKDSAFSHALLIYVNTSCIYNSLKIDD